MITVWDGILFIGLALAVYYTDKHFRKLKKVIGNTKDIDIPDVEPVEDSLNNLREFTESALFGLSMRTDELYKRINNNEDAFENLRDEFDGFEEWTESTITTIQENTQTRKPQTINLDRRTIAMLLSYDATFWETDQEPDFGEGGVVLYDAQGDFDRVLEAAKSTYHDVASSRAAEIIGIAFMNPEGAPEEVVGAPKIFVRTRLNRERVGDSHWIGDDTEWRNE